MDTLVMIVAIIPALIIWRLYHKIFNVMYFGCNAMIWEMIICYLVGIFIVGLGIQLFSGLISIAFTIFKWILIIGVPIAIISIIISAINSKKTN